MKAKFFLIPILSVLPVFPAAAQFYNGGTGPAGLEWRQTQTPSWRVIYPAGADSLARVYASELENNVRKVGASAMYSPNMMYRRPMPVVLRTRTAESNGMVVWTPRRMELYTTPSSFCPEAQPWTTQLAVHESRHVAQLQFGAARPFRALNVLSGQLWTGAASALWGGPVFFEGDAVVAETALSDAGRGRTADFLEYWRACSLEGHPRSWWQWRYGSQARYTPDYYRAGYVAIGGIRAVLDAPTFTADFYRRISDRFLPVFNFRKTLIEQTGRTPAEAYREIMADLGGQWMGQALERAPYTACERFSAPTSSYTAWSRLTASPEGLLGVRSGISETPSLYLLPYDGSAPRRLSAFSYGAGTMHYCEATGRLYWSEIIPDRRWELASMSVIRWRSDDGTSGTLAGGNLFNPVPSPDGKVVAAVEYSEDGRCAIWLIDSCDGTSVSRIPAPDGLQPVELAWSSGRLRASAITEGGFGIWDVSGGFAPLLEASPVKIKCLSGEGDTLLFTCDRGGSDEIYSLTADGVLIQLTSSKIGASDGVMTPGGLYFTSEGSASRSVFFARRESLRGEAVSWTDITPQPWADTLSEQESNLFRETADSCCVPSPWTPYRGFRHLFSVHSWVPVYVNPDAVAQASMETLAESARVGATVFFQNDLGTFSGTAGVFTLRGDGPSSGASLQAVWQGSYPVVEASMSLGERYRRQYTVVSDDGKPARVPHDLPGVCFSAALRTYVPLSFSGGGWLRAVIPSATISFSNDVFNSAVVQRRSDNALDGSEGLYTITGYTPGRFASNCRATASVRGYAMLPVPSSCLYPRWGIGAEAGFGLRPFLTGTFSPETYLFAYGYMPGFIRNQGLKLSALAWRRLGDTPLYESGVNVLPRGFAGSATLPELQLYPFHAKLTADYAIPFASLDWDALCPFVYVRNLEAYVHSDYCYLCGGGRRDYLLSAGADLKLRLSNLAFIPYDTRVGVRFDFNSGSSVEPFPSVKLLFDIAL